MARTLRRLDGPRSPVSGHRGPDPHGKIHRALSGDEVRAFRRILPDRNPAQHEPGNYRWNHLIKISPRRGNPLKIRDVSIAGNSARRAARCDGIARTGIPYDRWGKEFSHGKCTENSN